MLLSNRVFCFGASLSIAYMIRVCHIAPAIFIARECDCSRLVNARHRLYRRIHISSSAVIMVICRDTFVELYSRMGLPYLDIANYKECIYYNERSGVVDVIFDILYILFWSFLFSKRSADTCKWATGEWPTGGEWPTHR